MRMTSWELVQIEALGDRATMRMQGYYSKTDALEAMEMVVEQWDARGYVETSRSEMEVKMDFDYGSLSGLISEQPTLTLIVRLSGLRV